MPRLYTDQEERAALLDGASALRYRSDRLRSFASAPDEFAKADEFAANAEVLKEMAACYEVSRAAA